MSLFKRPEQPRQRPTTGPKTPSGASTAYEPPEAPSGPAQGALPPGTRLPPAELEKARQTLSEGRAFAPHCDARILHAPLHLITVSSLVWSQEQLWLSFHPIVQAPVLPDHGSTSRGSRAPSSTSVLVIPLTEPASRVLASQPKRSDKDSASGSVNGTAYAITSASAPSAPLSGERPTLPPLRDELNWPKPSGLELPLPEPMFARSALAPARIVVPVSHGSSWNLTIGTAVEGWVMRQSRPSSVRGRWSGSNEKLPSAIWSVLTAIESELTTEQWQQERERRSDCWACDLYPDWQQLRELWGIDFTGHSTPGKLPCPADYHRPPGSPSDHRQWPNNRAEGKRG